MDAPNKMEELKRTLVDMANANEAVMDGTMTPVLEILHENEVVFAIWQDPTAKDGSGVDMLLVKGHRRMLECIANGKTADMNTSAIVCIEEAQAVALAENYGEGDRRH